MSRNDRSTSHNVSRRTFLVAGGALFVGACSSSERRSTSDPAASPTGEDRAPSRFPGTAEDEVPAVIEATVHPSETVVLPDT
ncbi:hypothetical protein, partial [Phytoactinopolyspora endophytica]|uniref:hypothetical protein n=1 Tax=Phytoactinopolyspora endophytica TaxID=1642495 RepID=UPI00197C35C3